MEKLAKFGVTLLALAAALFPVWLYLIAKNAFDPQGFWQEFFLFGVGVWFLGGLQILLLIVFGVFALKLWADD